jgi:hypothetical protein
MQLSDTEVIFVGRFKESKRVMPGERGFTLNVSSYGPWLGGSVEATGDDTNTEAVYPSRCVCLGFHGLGYVVLRPFGSTVLWPCFDCGLWCRKKETLLHLQMTALCEVLG